MVLSFTVIVALMMAGALLIAGVLIVATTSKRPPPDSSVPRVAGPACPRCGYRNVAHARYCAQCGATLDSN